MSEEEKKAIKCLEVDMLDNEQIQIILNLIEKQQTEIEKLKQENKDHLEALTEWANGERINDIKHISKDKIREKIEELNAMEISQDIYYDDIKEMFEELLEE